MHRFPRPLRLSSSLIALALWGGCLGAPISHTQTDDDDTDEVKDTGEPIETGCDGANEQAGQPFGNHAFSYASGAIRPDSVSQASLDTAVKSAYEDWKRLYLKSGCGDGRYYVATGMYNSLTVSEAHGYGMIITAYMAGSDPDAKRIYDGLYYFFRDHPSFSNGDLMAWSQDSGCQSNLGGSSATDGDMDIAFSLLLADKQWGSSGGIDYHGEALRTLSAISRDEVDSGHGYMLLGDWTDAGEPYHYDATRSSDFMPAHLASFADAQPGGPWANIRSHSYDVISAIQTNYSSSTGLLPDFIQNPGGSNPSPVGSGFLEGAYDGEYSYNACRTPWRIGMDFLQSGDARARTALGRLNSWIKSSTGQNPNNIRAGYWLDGDAYPGSSYTTMAFVAPFGVAAMADSSNQAWLNQLWQTLSNTQMEDAYYADTIKVLTMIAISGNWWSPEDAPCP